MSKIYGICINTCNIDDTISNNKRQLLKCDLVHLVYINEQFEKCSLKLLSDNDIAKIKFANRIYSCDIKNIRIVPHELLLFLIGADYTGRLNILHNEKDILDLQIDSIVTLKFIDHKKLEYSIKFVIDYIGPIAQLGTGYYIGLNFEDFGCLRDVATILTKLHTQFSHQCEETASVIIVRAEQIYSGNIILDSEKLEPNDVGNKNPSCKNLFAEFYTTSFERNESTLIDLAILDGLDETTREKSRMLICLDCRKILNLFIYPCKHSYCHKCLLNRSFQVKSASPTRCPQCGNNLNTEELILLNNFLDRNLSTEDEEKSMKIGKQFRKGKKRGTHSVFN